MTTRLSASERLREGTNSVLQLWEVQSRRIILSAQDEDSHTVRDELKNFLSALVENLREERPNVGELENVSAQHHGQQRAGLTGYTLLETVKEYGLLRKVLVSFLIAGGPISEQERKVIHETVDNALELASHEFATAEQARIKLALAKAEQSNRDLEQFAAVAAHDLRSPLNSIGGFTVLLKEELASNASVDAKGYIDYIDRAVKRMTALIEGILSYAKLSQAHAGMRKVLLEEPVKAAIQNLKSALTDSSGRVGHEEMPEVLGDMPLLTQLFQNLFSNAIRYRGERPPMVDVSVRDVGDEWEVCVRDNGCGFDMKYKDMIFELHKQLETSESLDGLGLGLATCRKVVEYHGGKIWAESQIGIGSKFYITFPKNEAALLR